MSAYKLQFSDTDISNYFIELKNTYHIKNNPETLSVIKHDMVSILSRSISGCSAILDPSSETDIQNYLNELGSFGDSVFKSINSIFDLIVAETDIRCDDSICEFSKTIYTNLQKLSKCLPITSDNQELTSLSDKERGILQIIDRSYYFSFYVYNQEFAVNQNQTFYSLKMDLKRDFDLLTVKGLNVKDPINIQLNIESDMETKVDYLRHVIFPLISNIDKYAFNPETKESSHLENESLSKLVQINDSVNENQKMITIQVKDNGVGVSQEIQDKLFQKGVSIDSDTQTDHGIGLWGAKQFVEQNGGTMWCESEVDEGTSFYFTIPYDIKNHITYAQSR